MILIMLIILFIRNLFLIMLCLQKHRKIEKLQKRISVLTEYINQLREHLHRMIHKKL